MILDRTTQSPAPASAIGGPGLDDLFRKVVDQYPDALALIDPPDRDDSFGFPKRLTYAEADRIVSAISVRLRSLGLATDSIVALQLPNCVEGVLTLLGVLRAGLIAAPLPILWRQVDAANALQSIAPRALITINQLGGVSLAETGMHIAAEIFSIRFVCAFGRDIPDGVVPLDDVFAEPVHPDPGINRVDWADHVAMVTFDVTAEGMMAVARSHREFIGASELVVQRAGLQPQAKILMTLATSSFAGLVSGLGAWLLTGGALVLHNPFTPEVFCDQLQSEQCDVAVIPGPLAARFADAGLFNPAHGLKTVLAVWRSPERMSHGTVAVPAGVNLVDLAAFGEIALVPVTRQPDGSIGQIPAGILTAPPGVSGIGARLDIAQGVNGTLACGGTIVPHQAFPPGDRARGPRLKAEPTGRVDTGFPCRVDRVTLGLVIDGPPAGIVAVGGYRFIMRDLQDLMGRIDDGARIAALPDAISGHRLAGVGANIQMIREALIALGANPLLTEAFRERRADDRASAA